ncbi:MAG: SpoIIE family protein phosphatase [Candidatus Eremiobacteraeota bacterium]|nr:SpoIIE family protein phosphatase [Candidatus Eremiobacteraeota bacterium]
MENRLMCDACARRMTAGHEDLIARCRKALASFSKQLPPKIQDEILSTILEKIIETFQAEEIPGKVCTLQGTSCDSLHESGHVMARQGYTIDEVLERFAMLQDIFWEYLSESLRQEKLYDRDMRVREEFFQEHASCHYKLKLFFNEITASIARAYVEELQKIVLEKEEELLLKERLISSRIMGALLPAELPPIHGIDIAGKIVTTDAVGGDFWDISRSSSDSLEVILADVMGHGASAALLVSMIKYLLMAFSSQSAPMARTMEKINAIISRDTPEEIFITALYLRYMHKNRRLSYVSAGHPPPVLVRGGRTRELRGTDIPLGLLRDASFNAHSVSLKAGDVLYCLSDGVAGARNPGGEFFPPRDLHKAMRELTSLPAAAVCDEIVSRTLDFCGKEKCSDDITVVVLKILE